MTDPVSQDAISVNNAYGGEALGYRLAQWHPFLLPAGQKAPPPDGRTGRASIGREPNTAEIGHEAGCLQGPSNIGVRMPTGVVGIDVDAYGAKPGREELHRLITTYGPLPETWASTARDDGVSGIRFYRIPDGVELVGSLPGIELIQAHHRYAVVAPSIHPGGMTYAWYMTSGGGSAIETGEVTDIPRVETLPELPPAWASALSVERGHVGKAELDPETLNRVGEWLTAGDPCEHVSGVLRALGGGISRHDEMTRAQLQIMRLGEQGHPGAAAGILALREWFTAALAGERDPSGEWGRALKGAAQVVAAEPSAERRGCAGDGGGSDDPALGDPGAVDETPCGHMNAVAARTLRNPDDVQVSATHAHRLTRLGCPGLNATLTTVRRAFDAVYASSASGAWSALWGVEVIGRSPEEITADKAVVAGRCADPEAVWARVVERSDEAARAERVRLIPACCRFDELTASGRVLPPPHRPSAVADAVKGTWTRDGVPVRRFWRDSWMDWTGTHWRESKPSTVRADFYERTKNAMYTKTDKRSGVQEIVPWDPNRSKVADLMEASEEAMRLGDDVEAGSWTDGAPVPAGAVVALRNGILEVSTRVLHPCDPRFFNLASADVEFDPAAACPEFEKFLHEIFGDDAQAIEVIQEWFGYVLSGRTDLQKILYLMGPPRSGKGTLGRVLTALTGAAMTASPTLASLATNFGMSNMIGKSLALVPDARTPRAADMQTVIERMLSISGEDSMQVDRKNRDPWEGRMTARLMLLSNELPGVLDNSGALTSRLVLVTMSRSFLGREDITLEERLLEELPGILNWSLAGLDRLVERGRFTVPESSATARGALTQDASPVQAFVDEMCVVGPDEEVTKDALYAAWRDWCQRSGRDHAGTKERFSVRLLGTVYGLTTVQRTVEGVRVRSWVGARLNPEAASAPGGQMGPLFGR